MGILLSVLTDTTLVVEITGITGAAYPPAILRLVSRKLRDHWFVLSDGRARRLVFRHHVDNTLLLRERPQMRERANALILKGGSNLTDDEMTELVAISHEADRLILEDISGFPEPVDLVVRRGGVLQSCVHIEDRRWERMRPERELEPKLLLLLTAKLPVMREAYEHDREFQKLRAEHPEYYCATPERAEAQQSEWETAVKRLPGVIVLERKAYDPEVLAMDLCELIVHEGRNTGLHTLRRTSCFLSYSAKDQRFCDRLFHDLKTNGIHTSYFREHPYEAGQSLWEQIERSIATSASVVLVASKDSLSSQAVVRELQLTIDLEQQRNRRALRVAAIDDFVFGDWRHQHAERVRGDIVADFRNCDGDATAYDRGLKKLLAGLRTI